MCTPRTLETVGPHLRDLSRLCSFSELVSGVNSAGERLDAASITGAIIYQCYCLEWITQKPMKKSPFWNLQ